jgi:hypothetical protein
LWLSAWRWVDTRELTTLSGILTLDNKPTPPNACQNIPANQMIFIFGRSASFNDVFPHTVIEVGEKPLVVINKKKRHIPFLTKDYITLQKFIVKIISVRLSPSEA